MTDAEALNRRLVDELAAAGALPEEWRAVFLAVPRHLFVPDVIWEDAGEGTLTPRRCDEDPAAWLAAVYADEAIVTQVDDGATPGTGTGRRVTSSISKPSIVAKMLGDLQVERGTRILEIGTGTGWNAALLAQKVGAENVTTIEVDGSLAERARTALAGAGVSPVVVTGDGTDGYPPSAPYDRILATASVRVVPYPWVAQTRPGGLILSPWGNAYDNGALVRLTVDDRGAAYGPFLDNTIAFMWVRAQRVPRPAVPAHLAGAADSTTTLHPDAVAFDDYDARFAVGVRVPDVVTRFEDAGDGGDDFTFWAFCGESWARVDVIDGAFPHRVRQHGPRALWTEIEAAYRWWEEAGRPETGRFGLAVTADRQYIYLDSPDAPVRSGN
ncbi:methyltransferase domain-containing protein [Actinoallomurus rhizosphaericola]|uniref:methyltransferase domain-containing protein n=1 Tax=Actinoallomurus rhizosphaericola TaxID=2952536 RepID=UPI0020921E24|nr:methyltransferase domain-containing protein [Actinoallomurus rhizosphaericola]MCO5998611.1 methyltransferase domain-containing protein [Actinoallomurus rhizosphaericola]